jgi:hypothetical protein
MLPQTAFEEGRLLAIDLGLRTGLAVYGGDGLLIAYASRHFANRGALKRAAFQTMRQFTRLTHLVIEGGGDLSPMWAKEGERMGLECWTLGAEEWIASLFGAKQTHSGRLKDAAVDLCRQIIEESAAPRAKSIRHDAAEAILVGHFAVNELRWRQRGRTAQP